MSGFIRSSHYRHVYVDPPKAENCYKGFRLATVTGEQQYIKGNTKFFAVALQVRASHLLLREKISDASRPLFERNESDARRTVGRRRSFRGRSVREQGRVPPGDARRRGPQERGPRL